MSKGNTKERKWRALNAGTVISHHRTRQEAEAVDGATRIDCWDNKGGYWFPMAYKVVA